MTFALAIVREREASLEDSPEENVSLKKKKCSLKQEVAARTIFDKGTGLALSKAKIPKVLLCSVQAGDHPGPKLTASRLSPTLATTEKPFEMGSQKALRSLLP